MSRLSTTTRIILLFSLIICGFASHLHQLDVVNIVCEDLYSGYYLWSTEPFGVCIVNSTLLITNIETKIRKINLIRGQQLINPIEVLQIEKAEKLLYLPFGMNEVFPSLKTLQISYSGLLHLDQQDMKPFGSKLEYVGMSHNKLTALESDLFEFNTKLIHVDFSGNPLKYINPQFIGTMNTLNSLNAAVFDIECCVRGKYVNLLNIKNCKDVDARESNLRRIESRKTLKLAIESWESFSEDHAYHYQYHTVQIVTSAMSFIIVCVLGISYYLIRRKFHRNTAKAEIQPIFLIRSFENENDGKLKTSELCHYVNFREQK